MNYVFSKKKVEVGDRGFVIGNRFIPVQNDSNKIYGPTEGLVFYIPLDKDELVMKTGQTLTKTGTIVYQEYNGVPCAYFNGSCSLNTYDRKELDAILETQQLTLSFWIYLSRNDFYDSPCFVMRGNGNDRVYGQYEVAGGGKIEFFGGNDEYTYNLSIYLNEDFFGRWVHICQIGGNGVLKVYFDGVLQGSRSKENFHDTNESFKVGSWEYGGYKGYMSSIRIYNRVLTEDEISLLANEFDV